MMRNFLPILLLIIFTRLLNAQPAAEGFLPKIHLTDSVPCTEVKDQAKSPTCWVFGTNSLFESDLIKMYGRNINLSEMFIARHAYIDKARKWLATKGKTYYEGGGQFHDVIRVINNYGAVPEEAYPGKPKGAYSHNHAKLDSAMRKLVRRFLVQGKTRLNAYDLKLINDTLDRYLGKLPKSFWYDMKPFTPKTFSQEVLQWENEYVELMSFANLPMYKKCLLDDKFNWAGDSLYNIPLEDLQMLADTALATGWSVGWEGDVTEPGFNYFSGYATVNYSSERYDEDRLKNFKNESTERDHMLHLVGIGRDENNKKWYYFKNSWGTWFSKFDGYLYMQENYFKLNTVIMMVNKAAIPEKLKSKLGIK